MTRIRISTLVPGAGLAVLGFCLAGDALAQGTVPPYSSSYFANAYLDGGAPVASRPGDPMGIHPTPQQPAPGYGYGYGYGAAGAPAPGAPAAP
jgi:hypothetical protein